MAIHGDRLTERVREALLAAIEDARTRKNSEITIGHLVHALIGQRETAAVLILTELQAHIEQLQKDIEKELKKLPTLSSSHEPGLQPAVDDIFSRAEKEAAALQDSFVSTEHILLAVLTGTSTVADLLRARGVTYTAAKDTLMNVRGTMHVTDQNPESKYKVLEKYGTDFTARARAGKLDPVIGRDEEIRRVIQVLARAHTYQ
jgi:ATP-dependent Clp protease ATP-binding subunit ClpB